MAHYPAERWHSAALAIASGSTQAEAAEAADVGVRTVRRWLTKSAFRRVLNRYRDELVSQAAGRLASHLTRAADTLVSLLSSENETVRLRAATELLTAVVRLRSDMDLAERVSEIEERVNA
jgi:hypothetical protein